MIVTNKSIPRRTVLRSIGMTLALPLLDSMVPAFASPRILAAKPVRRLGVVYLPNGMAMQYWTPATPGTAFELTPILQPLARFRDHLSVLSGLTNKRPGGNHAGASAMFLTGVQPKPGQGTEIRTAISMDQLAARELGLQTQIASLELSLDSRDFAGSCDIGYSCAYTNTISWRTPSTPLPMENNPRIVFERLFGDNSTTDSNARTARLGKDRSILDSVIQKIGKLQREVGPSDHVKISEYLDAIRDVERGIQKAEEQGLQDLSLPDQPAGIPATFKEHAKLMFELQVLAYQADLTRVITFMTGREITGRTYTEIGVPDSHHPLSHHQDDPARIATLSKINTYHSAVFADFLERLASTSDGDGSLLDHVTIIYGAGMSDSNAHAPDHLPIILVGGGTGQLKGGRHVVFTDGTPLANLHLTVLEKLGVPMESLGDSTGKLQLLSGI